MRTVRAIAWWAGWLLLSMVPRLQATETVTLYVTNAQGTVVAEMTPQGQVTYEATYRPYGTQVTGVPQAGPGYTGHVNDPDSGLVYMQARYYDPDVGRFLSVDPVGPNAGNGFNFNRYAYADNSPIVNTDPSGMCSQPGVPDPVCPQPQPAPPPPPSSPEVSPTAQRMRDTSDCGGCVRPSIAEYQRAYMPSMGAAGQATDAVGSLFLGAAFNAIKRPTHPTRVSSKFSHQIFMVGSSGEVIALSPYPMAVIGASAPVMAEGASVVSAATMRHGRRAIFAGCVAISMQCGNSPGEVAEDLKRVQEIYIRSKEAAMYMYRQVFNGKP